MARTSMEARKGVATGADRVRQVVVAVSAVAAVVGSFIGSGAAGGTKVQDAAGGALAADATLIAPAGPAFSIWTVIYAGLLAYAVWQFLPSRTTAARHRAVGYWVAASLLLNAAWILSIQAGLLWLSLVVIVALLAVLAVAFVIIRRHPAEGTLDAVITDGTIGLYLGWVCVATAANTAAVLTAAGFDGFGLDPDVWGVVIVAAAGAIGVALALWDRGRIAPTLSLAWGLAWVAVARWAAEPASAATALAAVVAVIAVVVVTIVARLRAPRRTADAAATA